MLHHTDRLFRMTIQNISVEATIERVKTLIAEEKELSPALKSSLEALLLLVTLIVNRLGLNSKNSSKPPSMDPNRRKKPIGQGGRKPGGQQGRSGTTLQPVPDPDEIKDQQGKRYVAPFPDGVTRPVQYGNSVKVNSVYMSQYQLIPYNRIEDHFLEQLRIPVSGGSIFNFNQEAY